MFNPFAIFNTVIAAPEAPARDETQEMPVITLHSRSITAEDTLLGYAGLIGRLCSYRHIRDEHRMYTGHILDVVRNRYGSVELLIQPTTGQGVQFEKWMHISDVRLAWYDVEEQ